MRPHVLLATAALAAATAGCASRASDVAPAYVSPVTYGSYSCRQLSAEAERVSSRALQASGQQDERRSRDAVATGVAAVIFWPAAFAIGGDNAGTAELARLKGQMDAIEQASIQKRCGIAFRRT